MKNKRSLFIILISLLAALFIVAGSVGAAPKDGPQVTLDSAQGEFKASQDVLVTVTLSNPTGHSVRILNWFTPVNGLEEPVFQVKRDGEPVAYTGAIYKRPPATGSDYLSLKSGESVSYEVNLGDYYDLSGNGQYDIFYYANNAFLFNEKGGDLDSDEALISNVLSLKVAGRSHKAKPNPWSHTPIRVEMPSTPAQLTSRISLSPHVALQQPIPLSALSYLNTGQHPDSRYTTWFGIYSSSRYSTVTNHFTAIDGAFINAGITFDCRCKQNYYAYVYPTQPYKIYLCRVFWMAPPIGTDSRAGTLIHEMSHFNVVASTDDYVYGQTGAKALAIEDPNKAVNNADNHEYFSENTPTLP